MLYFPALNLFFYNSLLVYIARQIKRIIKAPSTNVSVWQLIPIFGKFLSPQPIGGQQGLSDIHEFNEILWNVNIYLNLLLLFPAICQHRHLSLLVAVIIMWNFYVFERVVAFFACLVWSVLWSDLSWIYFGFLVLSGILMNAMHLVLIVGTLKLQTCILDGFHPDTQWPVQAQTPPPSQPIEAE
ncbi:hypothetical protein KR009_011608, partial [Drosophila setifemur]